MEAGRAMGLGLAVSSGQTAAGGLAGRGGGQATAGVGPGQLAGGAASLLRIEDSGSDSESEAAGGSGSA